MPEVETIGSCLSNGMRAQVHSAVVGEEHAALKIVCRSPIDAMLCTKCMMIQFRQKSYLKQEMKAYEHLSRSKSSPSLKLPRYFGTFRLSESLISTFAFQRLENRHKYAYLPNTPYKWALGFEEFNGVGLDTVINDLRDTSLARLEKGLLQTIRALHHIGMCHGDIKEDNILLDPAILEGNQQAAMRYMVIDLSDAVLKHKTTEHRWRECKQRDLSATREIFTNARADKVRPATIYLWSLDIWLTSMTSPPGS